MSIMLHWGRLESSDSDYNLIKEMFTEVINQVTSRLIFSQASIQSGFCSATVWFAICWPWERMQLWSSTIFYHLCETDVRYVRPTIRQVYSRTKHWERWFSFCPDACDVVREQEHRNDRINFTIPLYLNYSNWRVLWMQSGPLQAPLLNSLAACLRNHEILWLNATVYTVSNPLTCLHTHWQPLHDPEG